MTCCICISVLGSWFHASITWTENRLRPLRRRKPLALLFPIQGIYTDTRIRWDCLHMYTVDITQHVSKSCFHQLDNDMPTNHDQTDDDRLALRDTG